ncbi:MAG: AI-2E family transporter [Bacteroidales bacterium]|nr:AI-2E family transporter [Bacteroidales bacterium]
MEENNTFNGRYTERLARLLLTITILVVLYFAVGYFRNVLIYIAAAGVVSLIGRPVMTQLRKIKVRKKSAPDALLAVFTILVIMGLLAAVISGVVPVVRHLVTEISRIGNTTSMESISANLRNLNSFLISTFSLDYGFKIENVVLDYLKSALNVNIFSNVIGSVASAVTSLAIGIFSVVFISFFFIKDDRLFAKIVAAITPDRLESKATVALGDVERLLSRYFVGLIIEMTIVGLIDLTGLFFVARLDFSSSLGIAFIAGLLNIIPYVGPWIGAAFGVALGVTLKFCSAGTIGLNVGFWVFVLVLLCIFVAAQLVDNYLLQPWIYSTSVKASPLEIFIVMLMAGKIGGIGGMLVAIPAYTVLRVFAATLFPDVKFIRRLTGSGTIQHN